MLENPRRSNQNNDGDFDISSQVLLEKELKKKSKRNESKKKKGGKKKLKTSKKKREEIESPKKRNESVGKEENEKGEDIEKEIEKRVNERLAEQKKRQREVEIEQEVSKRVKEALQHGNEANPRLKEGNRRSSRIVQLKVLEDERHYSANESIERERHNASMTNLMIENYNCY
jgi:hypothetical protein